MPSRAGRSPREEKETHRQAARRTPLHVAGLLKITGRIP
jgi:hypothetical protein